MGAGSRSRCRPPRPTSGRATTASGVALALDEPGRARGPGLEPRRDRAHGRWRGPQRADRRPRQPLRAGSRSGPGRGPRSSCPTGSAGGSRCTTRSRWPAAWARRRQRPWPVSSPPTRWSAVPLDMAAQLRISTGDRGPPGQRRGRAARRVRGLGLDAGRRGGHPVRRPARPAGRPVHPRAAAVDRGDAQGAADDRAARGRGRQPRRGRGRGRRSGGRPRPICWPG